MRVFRIVLIILLDIIFLGAFIFYLPELIQIFGNQLTAFLVVGVMIAGSGIVIGVALYKHRHYGSGRVGADKGVD